MIGYEDVPERSGEICICEIFGRDVGSASAAIGMGIHPFDDPELVDDFAQVPVDIDATEFHVYAAEWTPTHVEFFVDGQPVKLVEQSPSYPMQLMLGVYEFGRDVDAPHPGGGYPREFVVDYVRVYRDRREVPPRPSTRAGG
jgi:beta-glucanase (GH16 family)